MIACKLLCSLPTSAPQVSQLSYTPVAGCPDTSKNPVRMHGQWRTRKESTEEGSSNGYVDGDIDVDVMAGRGGRRRFHMDKSAYVRRLEFKLGEDPRIRTGLLSLVPATESVVDSKIKSADGRDLVTYGDLAAAQMKSFGEKTEWFQDTCAKLCVEWNEGHMRMNIRRQYLLGDSIDAVMSLSRKDLRKLWRFEFIGEMGIDAGGLAREWFELVCKEIFDPDMGLWTSSVTNQMSMTINPASGTCVLYFRINVLISFCAAFVSTNNLSNFARCSAWFLLSTS